MGERAFKLKVGDIKELCDFFALDRSGLTGKDDLVDCLLNFLSEPSDEQVKTSSSKGGSSNSRNRSSITSQTSPATKKRSSKGGGKSSAKATKKRGKSKQRKKKESSDGSESEADDDNSNEDDDTSAANGKEDDDDGIDLLHTQKGDMPNDATLRKWVTCFVQCYDLDKASVKVALAVAGEKFGVNLAEKKDLLKQMLTEAMT